MSNPKSACRACGVEVELEESFPQGEGVYIYPVHNTPDGSLCWEEGCYALTVRPQEKGE